MIVMLLVDEMVTMLSLQQNHQHQVTSISFTLNPESTRIVVDLSINSADANSLSGHDHSSNHFGELFSMIDLLTFVLTHDLSFFLSYVEFFWLFSIFVV